MSLHSVRTALDGLTSRLSRRDSHALAAVAVPTALVLLSAVVYQDYYSWVSFGTGGTPPTWSGYGKITRLRIKRWLGVTADGKRDLRDAEGILPEAGEKEEEGVELKGWLRGEYALPERKGERPKIVSRPLPQRHEPQLLPEDLKKRLFDIIPSLHAQRPDLLTLDLSLTEGKSSNALFARPSSRAPEADTVKKELAHVMLYAPRDQEELETVKLIVKAAVSFGTGQSILD
ncbi:hypothetical protein JCM8097_004233 [Rhodosporidiobolus ruineniae]